MEEVVFKIKKGIKTGSAEIDEYIEQLHDYVLDFDTSNIKKLIRSLDRLAGVIAEDIDKIIDGEDTYEKEVETGERGKDGEPLYETRYITNLKILSDSKDSKVYDRVMTLFTKVKDLDAVAKTAKGLIPAVEEVVEVAEQVEVKEQIKLSGSGNNFEEMQEIHQEKRKGKVIV